MRRGGGDNGHHCNHSRPIKWSDPLQLQRVQRWPLSPLHKCIAGQVRFSFIPCILDKNEHLTYCNAGVTTLCDSCERSKENLCPEFYVHTVYMWGMYADIATCVYTIGGMHSFTLLCNVKPAHITKEMAIHFQAAIAQSHDYRRGHKTLLLSVFPFQGCFMRCVQLNQCRCAASIINMPCLCELASYIRR